MKTIISYNEATKFIESLANVSQVGKEKTKIIALRRLQNVKFFLRFLGNPEKKLNVIHIAGTSGKGSLANMLFSIIKDSGLDVGVYTSPHTTTFLERIKVGDKFISANKLIELTNFLKDKMDEFVIYGGRSLNFFEFSFCLAIYFFYKTKCQWVILEAGMGGRLDASNAILHPVYTIVTNVGLDHTDTLGNSLKDIARAKAGIIKKDVQFLTGEKRPELLKIFNKELKIRNKKLAIKKIDYRDLKIIKADLTDTIFEYKEEKYKLKLLGEHQARNAVLAIECATALDFDKKHIKKGLVKTFYPARLEKIKEEPLIILDGAHNEDKLLAIVNFFKKQKIKGKKYLIFASAKNKETKVFTKFFKYFDIIYLTRFNNPFRKCKSLTDYEKIFSDSKFFIEKNNYNKKSGMYKKFAEKYNNSIYYKHYAKDALSEVLTKLTNDDLLLITGSIFLAGELRDYWYSKNKIIKTGKPK